MIFNSLGFLLFMVAVLGLYFPAQLSGSVRLQNMLLLAASYVFYGAWDWRFLGLIAVSTLVDYSAALTISRSGNHSIRRLGLLTSIFTNLGILGVFKYYDFFADSFIDLASNVGWSPSGATLSIVLPVGISFYTFQTMSYTIDVYRGEIVARDSLLTVALYVTYFPQLVAGPIERAGRLIPQLERPRPVVDGSRFETGLGLIALGLFKKVVIADTVALVSEKAFSAPDSAGWTLLVVGAVAFSIQIYGDFSGYSDIARGVSRLLGIELCINFRQPYFSRAISEFWRNWHISLSDWLHNYLYIPLGGNRHGVSKTYRNLGITMLLGGLWHGASWNFVLWGALHGAALSAHRAFGTYVPRGRPDRLAASDVPAVIGTFVLVTAFWIPFRADSFADTFDFIAGILTMRRGNLLLDDFIVVAAALLLVALVDASSRLVTAHVWSPLRNPAFAGTAFGLVVTSLVLVSGGAEIPFIYFQF